MAALVRRPDGPLHDLLDESGAAVRRAAALLREILVDPPARQDVARELLRCEQEADRITHDIIHRLNGGAPRGARPRAPQRADDGHPPPPPPRHTVRPPGEAAPPPVPSPTAGPEGAAPGLAPRL